MIIEGGKHSDVFDHRLSDSYCGSVLIKDFEKGVDKFVDSSSMSWEVQIIDGDSVLVNTEGCRGTITLEGVTGLSWKEKVVEVPGKEAETLEVFN